MTTKELNEYRAMAALGILEDQMNPIFIFNGLSAELLMGIISGKIDAVQMARIEMQNRGLDEKSGRWIGWTTKTTSDVLV
jgi:hypothetical protein